MDVTPRQKTSQLERIAQLVRMLGVPEQGEWENVWCALIREMHRANLKLSDLGNLIEQGEQDEGLYTEAELVEFGQAERAEGVKEGVRIGLARASSHDKPNGHLSLPKPVEMAEFCGRRLAYLRSDREREFVTEMVVRTQRGRSLTPRTLGYLASLYIGVGGRT